MKRFTIMPNMLPDLNLSVENEIRWRLKGFFQPPDPLRYLVQRETLQAMPHPGVVFRPLTDPPRGELFAAWNARTDCALIREFPDVSASEGNS